MYPGITYIKGYNVSRYTINPVIKKIQGSKVSLLLRLAIK